MVQTLLIINFPRSAKRKKSLKALQANYDEILLLKFLNKELEVISEILSFYF